MSGKHRPIGILAALPPLLFLLLLISAGHGVR